MGFFLSMENKQFLQPGDIFVKKTVIFYWVNDESQDCFCNPSPHPQKHVGKGKGGWFVFFKWGAAEHSKVDKIWDHYLRLSLLLSITGCLKHQMSFVHTPSYPHLQPESTHRQAKSQAYGYSTKLLNCMWDTHKAPFQLTFASYRKYRARRKQHQILIELNPFFFPLLIGWEKGRVHTGKYFRYWLHTVPKYVNSFINPAIVFDDV